MIQSAWFDSVTISSHKIFIFHIFKKTYLQTTVRCLSLHYKILKQRHHCASNIRVHNVHVLGMYNDHLLYPSSLLLYNFLLLYLVMISHCLFAITYFCDLICWRTFMLLTTDNTIMFTQSDLEFPNALTHFLLPQKMKRNYKMFG